MGLVKDDEFLVFLKVCYSKNLIESATCGQEIKEKWLTRREFIITYMHYESYYYIRS